MNCELCGKQENGLEFGTVKHCERCFWLNRHFESLASENPDLAMKWAQSKICSLRFEFLPED